MAEMETQRVAANPYPSSPKSEKMDLGEVPGAALQPPSPRVAPWRVNAVLRHLGEVPVRAVGVATSG
jgi:hypothetical protein